MSFDSELTAPNSPIFTISFDAARTTDATYTVVSTDNDGTANMVSYAQVRPSAWERLREILPHQFRNARRVTAQQVRRRRARMRHHESCKIWNKVYQRAYEKCVEKAKEIYGMENFSEGLYVMICKRCDSNFHHFGYGRPTEYVRDAWRSGVRRMTQEVRNIRLPGRLGWVTVLWQKSKYHSRVITLLKPENLVRREDRDGRVYWEPPY